MDEERGGHRVSVLGIVLTVVGAALLLERTQLLDLPSARAWWPLALVGAGLARLVDTPADLPGAIALMMTGGWLLVVTLTPVTFRETWPVLLILWGVLVMMRGPRDGRRWRVPSRSRSEREPGGGADVR